MSRNDVPSHVAALAQKQMGNNLVSAYPLSFKEYCEELRKHLSVYPHDTHFAVAIHPGRNFGIVTCLESGCQSQQIPLIERIGVRDGGLTTGVGSLSSYRMHVARDEAHRKARDTRIKGGQPAVKSRVPNFEGPSASPHTPGGRRSALLDALDANAGIGGSQASSSRPLNLVHARQLLAQSSAIKAEPVEAVIPRKRTSEIPNRIKKEDSFEGISPSFSTPLAKRVKSDAYESPKTPLGLVNRDPPSIPSSSKAAMLDDELAETRLKLGDIQLQISRTQVALSKAQHKPNKTKADETRITKLQLDLWKMMQRKEEYNASIPTVASGAHRAGASMHGVYGQSISSGSNVQLPPAFQNPAFAQQVIVTNQAFTQQHHAPMASSSNVKLEARTGSTKMEIQVPEFDFQRMTAGIPGMPQPLSDDERFDGEGNFFGRGRDMFRGPVAKADDVDKFLLAAGNAEQFDGNASVDSALQKLGLPALYLPLPGMEVALMPHQVIGVAWMLEKEKGDEKGGCMADEMGLGKTVQMIATIAANRSHNPLQNATLIVAPLALLDQWQMEIEMKTNLNLQCLIYHGNNKPRNLDQLKRYDIVLTTFHTLANEWPDEEAAEKEKAKRKKRKIKDGFVVDDGSEDEKVARKRGRKSLGLLFLVDWYRVVLDEAQNIRNRRTRVSRAVSQLGATYRWCLTGTPIINCLADAYGLLRFLRYRPWYDWQKFNSDIARLEKKNPQTATIRLQAIFKAMLLRRRKDSMLDGKRLIELPGKEVILHKLQFTQEERDIYKMVEARSQATFNRFLRAGTVLKNYTQVLVLLLRLRQICSHPSLIQEDGVTYIDGSSQEAGEKHTEIVRAERLMGKDFVQCIRAKFKQVMLDRMAAEKASAEATLVGDDFECPVCFDSYTEPVITSCRHSFCRDCINIVLNAGQREDAEEPGRYQADERPCPTCRGAISPDRIFSRTAFEPSDEELQAHTNAGNVDSDGDAVMVDAEAKVAKAGRVVRKRKASARRVLDSDEEEGDDDDDLSDFIVQDDEDDEEKAARRELERRLKGKRKEIIVVSDDEDDDVIFGAKPDTPTGSGQIKLMAKFLPSTKMKHMMESLKQWAETHPDEKTLIVSQWTQCLQLVSDYLSENEIAHVKYQGGMSRAMRDKAVRAFMSKDKATVMLMSLKCGGVGLNLTRANRVINLDLGWSLAIEQQAYDRVHRLGQTRDVVVHRLVVADTVEDRILALQDRKKGLADGSLGDGDGKKLGRLSVKELANLFGLDTRGRVL